MKIIILDDSMTIRMIIESFLEDLGVDENSIFSFEHGHDALEFIEANGADIVFTDINMPQMSGSEFVSKLLLNHKYLQNNLFAISGDESGEGFQAMRDSGVKKFLKKPLKIAHFNHFIRPIVSRLQDSSNSY